MNNFSGVHKMPSNTDAERQIIGQAILDKHISRAARTLTTTDFYDAFNRKIWEAFAELDANGIEIDAVLAFDIFKKENPQLAQNYSLSSLTAAATGLVPNFNQSVYVEKLKNCSRRRVLIRELNAQIGSLFESENLTDAKNSIEKHFADFDLDGSKIGNFRHLSEILESDVKPALLDLRHGITRKISTGFSAIDNLIGGGLSLSDVLCVAALPGAGKSAFVLQTAVNIAKQSIPVAFLSSEMSNCENALRLVSQATRSENLNSVQHLTADDLKFYNEWADALKVLPLYFDAKTYDLESLSGALENLVETCGIKVLIIDYIQLLKLSKTSKVDRYERITEASQEVKRIAMRFGICVIEVCQFNREGAKREKPALSDLEGSSQLEKDISLCFILDRDTVDREKVDLRIVKGRNVGLSVIEGRFTGINLNFEFYSK